MKWMPIAALLVPGLALALPPLMEPELAKSSLSFVGSQQGEKFTGTIPHYKAQIRYAAAELASSTLEVSIDLHGIDTRASERDEALAGADWFDVAHFPTASFRSKAVRMTAQGPVADAELTLHGKTKAIVFPFRYAESPGAATLDGKVTLDRRDFGLGLGEWADESVVAHAVEVNVHLSLRPAAAK
jgi:polyisoprenoid-binding protein YceI